MMSNGMLSVSTTDVDDNQIEYLRSPTGSDSLQVFEDTDSDTSEEQDHWVEQSNHWVEQVPIDQQVPSEHMEGMDYPLSELKDKNIIHNSSIRSQRSIEEVGHSSPFRLSRRTNPFAATVPVDITHDGRAPSLTCMQVREEVEEEEKEEVRRSFREFAHLSWNTNKLDLVNDEEMYRDDGQRHLDAFLLDEVDFLDIYPTISPKDSINPRALSKFCFPDGLRVRIIPRVALPGAMRMG